MASSFRQRERPCRQAGQEVSTFTLPDPPGATPAPGPPLAHAASRAPAPPPLPPMRPLSPALAPAPPPPALASRSGVSRSSGRSPTLAGESHEAFLVAGLAPDPQETVIQPPAPEVPLELPRDVGEHHPPLRGQVGKRRPLG
jgi:hypothetical protein